MITPWAEETRAIRRSGDPSFANAVSRFSSRLPRFAPSPRYAVFIADQNRVVCAPLRDLGFTLKCSKASAVASRPRGVRFRKPSWIR